MMVKKRGKRDRLLPLRLDIHGTYFPLKSFENDDNNPGIETRNQYYIPGIK